ncbi:MULTISPECIES: MSMEG_0569 family flavin-dependent oxidoreductase [unclassified Leptolyngbya]|uniref:MSMEG_0569 family flavin-dependent oxidoreductase n=1 Tax=unclassified Leptolyngbya TaxID=2650499 RepID=UPI001687E13B|nr:MULTISPECIES: MSMEG_0569 family flavin-dependent oxidoreductase [unclassified Leptolyngbya]MBD1911882.1 MSMEG_0569 family flavin-dependent oxidoreductase [Leptolyngbya sp. FACHB-8]MBD2156091.1 MSMEG_0569 family flavin-dependent oxidoreductase [Leptolyngbya sp. FACHB-16]
MRSHYPVVIVGGGQAGLSMSYCLKERGIEHLVFEKYQIAHSWRSKRWDSFCLVTPNWQCQLPGFPYTGDDPQGFMGRDAIVEYIVNYARSFEPPIREGVEVTRLRQGEAGGFEIDTSIGDYTADHVVIATGGYHNPRIPAIAERFPDSMTQLHSSQYKNPESLPEGAVLVVGTGQSGCQIAEDLHRAGRQVHLCVGSAPRSPRTYRGKDVVDWLDQMGYYDLPVDEHPQKDGVRARTNHYVSGRDGGKEIDLRQFATEGMQLHGRLLRIQNNQLEFGDDLKTNLDQADGVAESIKRTIDTFIEKHHIEAPTEPPYVPLWEPTEGEEAIALPVTEISTVIWATGYHMDFRWIELPVFDGKGYPAHNRGITPLRGLYFLGLPWLYTWGSGRFSGIARDAHYLVDCIASRHQVTPVVMQTVNEVAIGS